MLHCRYEEVGDITIPSVYQIRRVNVIARSFKNLEIAPLPQHGSQMVFPKVSFSKSGSMASLGVT